MTQPPAGPQGPVGTAGSILTAEDAWRKFMWRIGVSNKLNIQKGHTALVGVDRITGMNSKTRSA